MIFFLSKFHHYLNRFIISSRPILRSWPFWLSLHEILFSIKDKSADSIYNSSEDCAQYHTHRKWGIWWMTISSVTSINLTKENPQWATKSISVWPLKAPPPPPFLLLLLFLLMIMFLFFSPILRSSCFPKHLDACYVQPAQSYLLEEINLLHTL